MVNLISLDKVSVGDKCIVQKLSTEGMFRRRLLDLGIIDGTEIQVLLESPLGHAKAYSIRGTVIALRSEDCNKIFVKLL